MFVTRIYSTVLLLRFFSRGQSQTVTCFTAYIDKSKMKHDCKHNCNKEEAGRAPRRRGSLVSNVHFWRHLGAFQWFYINLFVLFSTNRCKKDDSHKQLSMRLWSEFSLIKLWKNRIQIHVKWLWHPSDQPTRPREQIVG